MAGNIPMENILNLRDAGATVNKFLGRKLVREGLLFRAARPDWATKKDRDFLTIELGIKSIIDLRTEAEKLKEVNKHAAADSKTTAPSYAETLDLIRMPGIDYHDVKVTGGPFDQWMMNQLSWFNYIRFLMFHFLGYRIEAFRIIGLHVLEPIGLVGLVGAMIDVSGQGITQALRTYIQPNGVPSLVHCSQGKDRTGLITSLVLMILGVPADAINHDYRLSDGALDAEREERLEELHVMGLADSWIGTDPAMIQAIKSHIDGQWGSLDGYLDFIGFTEAERDQMRELLLY